MLLLVRASQYVVVITNGSEEFVHIVAVEIRWRTIELDDI